MDKRILNKITDAKKIELKEKQINKKKALKSKRKEKQKVFKKNTDERKLIHELILSENCGQKHFHSKSILACCYHRPTEFVTLSRRQKKVEREQLKIEKKFQRMENLRKQFIFHLP